DQLPMHDGRHALARSRILPAGPRPRAVDPAFLVARRSAGYPTRMRTPHRSRLALAASTFRSLAPAEARPEADAGPPRSLWSGPIGFEGLLTGDGRLIERGALTWPADLSADEPMDFRYVSEDVGFHDGAVVVGHITALERLPLEEAQARLEALGRARMDLEGDIDVIWAQGDIVLDSEIAESAAAALADKRA